MVGKKLSLGDRIKQLRKQKGFTQDQVAEAAGIDSKSLSRIECNRFNPAIDTLENLAVALEIEMQDFFVADPSSPRLLRSYLFDTISTASDKEIVLLADAVKKVIGKQHRAVRDKR